MQRLFYTTGLISTVLVLLLSFSSNPPQRRSGAPGEGGCNNSGCHNGGAGISGDILIKGLPDQVVSGESYVLDILMIRSSDNAIRGGFQMTALDIDGKGVGTWSIPTDNTAISDLAGRTYVEHQPALFFENSDTINYGATWTAPSSAPSDHIAFYIGAVFANGNNNNSGDRVLFTSDTTSLISNNFNISPQIIHPNCNRDNGSITLNIMNQGEPVEVLWNNGDTTPILDKIGEGVYSVVITDINGQTIRDSFQLVAEVDTEDPVIICNTTEFNIGSCAPFSYPTPTAEDNCGEVTMELMEGLGSNQSFPLGETIDIYQASDASGNSVQCSIRIINNPQIDIAIQTQDITCAPDTLGSAMITINGANSPYDIMLEEAGSLEALTEGFHTVIITDFTGCQTQRTFEIRDIPDLIIDTVIVSNVSSSEAGDGAISVELTGGAPPYMYEWFTEDELFSTEENLNLLFPGEYTALITDINGCTIMTDTLIVDLSSSLTDINLANHIDIYPNPTANNIYIYNHSKRLIIATRVYNIHGQIVSEHLEGIVDQVPGVYYIHLIMDNGAMAIKSMVKL